MKQTIKFIFVAIVSAVVAMVAGAIALAVFNYEWAGVAAFFGIAILCAMVLGAFDDPARKEQGKYDSIRHYDGRRNYGQAAVFIGTACIFMGTPKECEDVCDDMWHNAQQAHMEMLSGEETEFNIL